jgi:hypothetical protein
MIDMKTMTVEDCGVIEEYLNLRPTMNCENAVLEQYIWHDFYHTAFAQTQSGLVWLMQTPTECYTIVPACKKENLQACFDEIQTYFTHELKRPMEMYLVDEEALQCLNLPQERYEVEALRRYADYIYDAHKLRTLSGRAYHKKKNHVNGFLKEYGKRCRMALLGPEHKEEILEFLQRWEQTRALADDYDRDMYEQQGISYVLSHWKELSFLVCGVYIDETLEAFSIGSYQQTQKMAVIHIEKANPDIRGLYAYINQQFLIHGFPEVQYVNREDDMGIDGLRQAKLSYHPVMLAPKYVIREKNG